MDRTTLYNIAKMYYEENKGQQEIAKIIGVSRPQISRFLKEARDTKIVNITLSPPFEVSSRGLSQKLEKILGINKVLIVEIEDYLKEDLDYRLNSVTTFAAGYLTERILECKTVGIGWGGSVYKASLHMQHQISQTPVCFLPLVGNAGMSDPAFQTNSIVDRVAEKFKADKKFINTPAYLLNSDMMATIKKSNSMMEINELWGDIDLAFFSIGLALNESETLMNSIEDKVMLNEIIKRNPVGDLLGTFFDQDGELCLSEENNLHISIPIKKLKKIPQRICIAVGEQKIKGLLGATKIGLYTELITDSITAANIINS